MSEHGAPELDLRAFLHILRRRLWVLVLVPVLVTGAAVVSANAKTPRYRATAEILIGRNQAESIFNPLVGVYIDPSRVLANQIRVISSQEVTALAKKRLGFAAAVTAKASTTEDVITLTAVDVAPKRAAAIVNAHARAYLEYRRSSVASETAAATAEVRRQVDETQARLDALDDEVDGRPVNQREQLRVAQSPERLGIVAQLSDQRTQLAKLEAAANVEQGGAQLLAPAAVPGAPFDPNPTRSGLLALVVGAMLGLGTALLLDYLDNRIRSQEDLERVTDVPVVALVPTLPGWRNRKATHVASIEEPTSAVAEAYRGLRTSIQFLGLDRSLKTLQVTSPASSEGKTTTLVNLAVALARAGERVVVVDCDLRRPRVHEFLGLDPTVGFTSVLVGDVALSGALQRVKGVPGLLVLTAGPVPPNPSELLSGQRTVEILNTLQADADVVLIDSPPVLPVSDAAALSTRVDGTLVVGSANTTQRKQLSRALEMLRQVEALVVGVVLNRAGTRRGGYDAYTYSYGPSSEASQRGARREPRQTEPARTK